VCELNSFERSSEFYVEYGATLFSSSHMSFKLFALAIADTIADQLLCRVFYPLLKFDDFCHIAVSRKYRIKHDQTQCSREQSAAGYENRMTNCKSMEVIKAAAAALNQQTDHHPVVLIEPTAMGSPCPFDSAGDVSTYVQVISCMYIKKLVQQEY
jgi:hypothetical protein